MIFGQGFRAGFDAFARPGLREEGDVVSRAASRWIGAVSLVAVLAVGAAACGGGNDNEKSSSGSTASSGDSGKKLKIALANSYIGNKWRIEMANTFKAACAMPPYKDQVDCSVFNSGNDVSKQTQQISNLISEHVDAIVLNAASPTGLNGVVRQACQRKILVVSFDNIVTEPCALKVNTDQTKFGQQLAQFLVGKLNGKGNVIMVTGVAGTGVDADRNKGAMAVFKQNPGMKVVGRYTGMWDSATAQRNTAAQLPSLPKVDGIWAQGGTDGVLKAFIDAKRPLPPTAGEAENGFRKFLTGYQGQKPVDGLSIGQPPYLSVVALELARAIEKGQHAKGDVTIPFPKVTGETVKEGETVFKDQADSFFADFTDSGPNATVKICVEAALTGKPCPGTLKVNLP
jgi:ribose transport system substrate-binding protein